MTWFKVDDGFPEHPKLEELEQDPRRYMAAVTVWTIMGADCARRTTDGLVTRTRLEKVLHCLGKAALEGAEALVRIGLWETVDGGYRYHDWSDYQFTKAEVDASRRAKTERQRRWRSGRVDASTSESTDTPRDAAHARVSRPVPIPIPPKPPEGVVGPLASEPEPESPDRGSTAPPEPEPELVVEVLGAEATRRRALPPLSLSRGEATRIAGRVAALLADGLYDDPVEATEALVSAAYDLTLGPAQRPLRLALLEATVGRANGRCHAQETHVPPEDPWV
jgi:hypothetical protein